MTDLWTKTGTLNLPVKKQDPWPFNHDATMIVFNSRLDISGVRSLITDGALWFGGLLIGLAWWQVLSEADWCRGQNWS
jgi:hypothetical protein